MRLLLWASQPVLSHENRNLITCSSKHFPSASAICFFCVCEWLTNCYKEPASPAWRCWEERWLIPLTSKPPSFPRTRGGVTAWQNDPGALLRAVWVRTASSSPAWQRWLQFKVSAVRCRFHCAANWKTRSRKVFLPVKQYIVSLLGSSSPGKTLRAFRSFHGVSHGIFWLKVSSSCCSMWIID